MKTYTAIFAGGFILGLVTFGLFFSVFSDFHIKRSVIRPVITQDNDDLLYISSFEAKEMPVDIDLKQQNDGAVNLQWKFQVASKTNKSIRYFLTLRFNDNDNFRISEATYDSNSGSGDIAPGITQQISGTTMLNKQQRGLFRKCNISVATMKTDAEIAQDAAEASNASYKLALANMEAQWKQDEEKTKAERAREEAQAKINAVIEEKAQQEKIKQNIANRMMLEMQLYYWSRLRLGMGKGEVEKLLGRPVTATQLCWYYDPIIGTGEQRMVKFDFYNNVEGWNGPNTNLIK